MTDENEYTWQDAAQLLDWSVTVADANPVHAEIMRDALQYVTDAGTPPPANENEAMWFLAGLSNGSAAALAYQRLGGSDER